MLNAANYKSLDIFLIEQLIKIYNYDIYIDKDFVYAEHIIHICSKNNISYQMKNKIVVNCLISGQRTGSTFFIDVLQKTSKNVLALSEIFYYYEGIETYSQSYDRIHKDGILYGCNIETFIGENIEGYFKQFEDLAIFQNKHVLLFKLTIDFLQSLDNFFNLNNILEFMSASKYNIIYLNRNELDMYSSKKLAEIYSYSNVIYKTIPEKMFSNEEYELFKTRKREFENKYIYNTIFKNNIVMVLYDELIKGNIANNINKIINKLNKTNIEYVDCFDYATFSSNDEKYYNIKQNLFSKDEIMNETNWV